MAIIEIKRTTRGTSNASFETVSQLSRNGEIRESWKITIGSQIGDEMKGLPIMIDWTNRQGKIRKKRDQTNAL